MLHYDESIGLISYFRPSLKNIVNKVYERNFISYNTLQGVFKIPLDRFSGWSFSLGVMAVAYIILVGGGYLLGTYIPIDLLILLAFPVFYLMIYNVFFSSLFHAIVLGIVINLLSGNSIFILLVISLFVIARLFIDIPFMKLMFGYKTFYNIFINIVGYGYEHPMTMDEGLIEDIKFLLLAGAKKRKIFRAYSYGYILSENTRYTREEVGDFIKSILEGFNDRNVWE